MSVPSNNAALVELASTTKLVQSQFDSSGPMLRSTSFSLVRATVRAMDGARENESVTPTPYCLLYRRPLPLFSQQFPTFEAPVVSLAHGSGPYPVMDVRLGKECRPSSGFGLRSRPD